MATACRCSPPTSVALWPSAFVTTTFAAPAVPAGAAAVSAVDDVAEMLVTATPPTVTVVPAPNSVPVSVIVVEPAEGPVAGTTAVSVGGGPR